MAAPILSLKNVCRSFEGKEVLHGCSLSIHKGEITVIVGHNGSGKSTLFKILSGMGTIDSGKREQGEHAKALSIGYAPDKLPKLRFTAVEYLMSMGRVRGVDVPELKERIEELCQLFRLETSNKQEMRHFSKGMLQKINIMQAMLQPTDILFMDEPLSGLDAHTQEQLIVALGQFKDQGMTIVTTSHETQMIEQLADRVITLKDGQIISDIRKYDGSMSPISYKVITYADNNSDEVDKYAGLQGIVHKRKAGQFWIVHVDSRNSDQLLQALLQAGASIESVENVKAKDSK
ncbi:ABC transporter ATP-binding protein [Cohnella abietis]|uniref:ABC transporter ATP-binding protein n=1 Tax=Cohnella abietis TaxID=2507935 RepID=A0A3T1DD21_9BACL|nr:ABC transporter ATP-binding protein [Cohnella abietis]BBI36046.1 ABC transporter ATP-binding protein [Cohnella abietis]